MKRNVQEFTQHLSAITIRSILKEVTPFFKQGNWQDNPEHDWATGSEDFLQQYIVQVLTSKENLARILVNLSQYEREALKYFIFQVSDDLLTYRQIEQGLVGIKPTTFRLGLTGLRRKGLVYTVRRQWGEVAYVLPADLGERLYKLFLEEGNWEKIEPCSEDVDKRKEEYLPIYIDLFLFLDELRAEKDCSVPLTKRGSIHKRFMRIWQEKWPHREEKLEALSFVYEHRDTYNRHTALLLDFLTRKKLITWYENKVVLNQLAAQQWMQYSRAKMKEEFLSYWVHVYIPSTPWLRRYQQDMVRFKDGEWIYLLSPVEYWEEEYRLPSVSQLKQLIVQEILEPLLGLGLVELGRTASGEEVWRWKVEPEESGPVWVQPTLEVYGPSTLSFSILWELTKLLYIEKWENMLIMSLSRIKVMACLEKGEKVKKWVNWLAEKSAGCIPTGFIDQLTLWEKSQTRVHFSQKTVIEIEDEYLANVWVKWPEFAENEVRQISPGIFLVGVEKEAELKQLFSQKGIPVKQLEKNEGEQINLVENIFSVISLPYEHDLKVENVFPEITEAIPAWSTLPELWKKQLSSYHEQTKRMIIRKAIEHELPLKVETKEGAILEILPASVQVEDGHWICYDLWDKKYVLEQLSKMQLLFPV